MEILPVDLTSLVAVILGISIVLVPVIGLTARYALKPLAEALGRSLENRSLDESVRVLERRVELQEHELESLQSRIRELSDTRDFDRQLMASQPTDSSSSSS